MEIFLFPIIFSIRAAISILLLLRVLSIFTFWFAIDLVQDLYQWSRFISWIAISSYTGRFWWSILQVIFVVPIMLYTFFWSVYDFGPKHRKRSLFDILRNPVPGIEFEGRPGESDVFDSLQRRRFNHCILARQIARRKHLTQKRTTQSMSPIVHDCQMSYIDPNAPRLYGYESYFTMHSESMGKQVTASEHSMPMTIYFAICQFSCPDIVFCELPRMPPKGIITHILLSTLITGIFGIITLRTCVSLTKQKLVAEIRAIRWTDRLIRSEDSHLPTNDALPIPHLSWNDGMRNNIESMVSILQKSLNLGFHFVRSLALSLNISLCQKIFLSASGELTSGVVRKYSLNISLCQKIFLSASGELTSGGVRKYFIYLWSEIFLFLREFRQWLHNFFVRRTTECVHAFTVLAHTTMADVSTFDPLSSFDTDSSFWVCDNSATGHICNNKELFTDELVPSIYEIGSATGISTPTLMGTVILRITDNEGAKHSFVLKNVNYLPSSPVNILSLRRLAELYPDDAGHPDRTGTGINSGYDSHTLNWDNARFSKTFHTASSGLPECLFSSGYSKLDVFSTMMSKVYDDTINWAFASKDKLRDLAQVDNGSSIVDEDGGIIYINGDDMTLDVPLTLTNLISFFTGMYLCYNNGKGT